MSDRTPPHSRSPSASSVPVDEQSSAGQHDGQQDMDAPTDEQPAPRAVGEVLRQVREKYKGWTKRFDRAPTHSVSPLASSAPSDEQGSTVKQDADAPVEGQPVTRTVGEVLRMNEKMTRFGTRRLGDPTIVF